jgi:hypothetical protein
MRYLLAVLLVGLICLDAVSAPAYALGSGGSTVADALGAEESCHAGHDPCSSEPGEPSACGILCIWMSPGMAAASVAALAPVHALVRDAVRAVTNPASFAPSMHLPPPRSAHAS